MNLDARNALADLDWLLELQALGPCDPPEMRHATDWRDPTWIAAWFRSHPDHLAAAIEAQRQILAAAAEAIAADRTRPRTKETQP